MPIQAIEAYTGASLTKGSTDGEWSATRIFQVTGATSQTQAIDACASPSFGAPGAVPNASHPANGRLICKSMTCDDGLVLRKVTANYTIPELGNFDPDPLKAKTVWRWVPGTITEPSDRDFYDNPSTNSVGIPWDQPTQKFYGTMELTATRNEPFYDAQKALLIQNCTNSDVVTVQGGGTVLKGQAFLITMGNENVVYDGVPYARVTYSFRFRKGNLIDGTDEYDAFWERRLDQGDSGYTVTGTSTRKLGLFCNVDGMTVGTVKLDGTGKPLDDTLRVVSVSPDGSTTTITRPTPGDPLPAEVKTVTKTIGGTKTAVYLVRRQYGQINILALHL